MQGIIYLVSHRNLICILYMTAIQDIFCVAVFLHRGTESCLKYLSYNLLIKFEEENNSLQWHKTVPLKYKQMKHWNTNRWNNEVQPDNTWHSTRTIQNGIIILQEKLWQWVTGTRWATTRLAPLWKCKAGLKFDQWSLTGYRMSWQLLP